MANAYKDQLEILLEKRDLIGVFRELSQFFRRNRSDSPNDEDKMRSLWGDFNILKEQLLETATWPSEYLYKFIVKSDVSKIAEIEALFDNTGAVINTIESKNGKYTSVSINVIMKNPDAVISKYIEVTNNVEGVISL